MVEGVRPGRLISLLPARLQPVTPPQVRARHHLRILVDDVERPGEGLTPPAHTHIEELVSFLRASPPHTSIVMHCLAGVSRSPAAALVALALGTPGRELEAARLLRQAAPFAHPNRLIVELGDVVLQRNGDLLAALEIMGLPDMSVGFAPFLLPRML